MLKLQHAETRKRPSFSDERGFTLPELSIIIAIMGILVAIAVPSWFAVIQGRAVDSATNKLAADLRLAHASATNQLFDWAVVSDPGSFASSAGFTFTGGAPTGRDYYLIKIPSTGTAIPASNVEGRYLDEDNRAQVAGSTPLNLRFKPDGSVRRGNDSVITGAVTVTVHRYDGSVSDANKHVLEVSGVTSRVKIDP